jgi:hypothetical protein
MQGNATSFPFTLCSNPDFYMPEISIELFLTRNKREYHLSVFFGNFFVQFILSLKGRQFPRVRLSAKHFQRDQKARQG